MYRRFKVVKEFSDKDGVIPVGSEITILNDRIYFNGGMISPAYYGLLYDLVEYEINEGFNYLREVAIPYNKI